MCFRPFYRSLPLLISGIKLIIYLELNNFRQIAINVQEINNGYIFVNFLRSALGEQGSGHMSPLAAYDKKTDRFLMLDVARYRYKAITSA